MNLFTRERELKELTEKLSTGQDELERLLKQMQDGQERKDNLKQRSAGALEELHQQEIAVARETERLQNAEADAATHSLHLRESEAAREQLMESMMQIRDQLSLATDSTEQTDKTREEMEAQAAELQQALTEARKHTEEKAEETLRLTLEVNDLKHEQQRIIFRSRKSRTGNRNAVPAENQLDSLALIVILKLPRIGNSVRIIQIFHFTLDFPEYDTLRHLRPILFLIQ